MSNPNIEPSDLFTPSIVFDKKQKKAFISFGSKTEEAQLEINLSNDPQAMKHEMSVIAGKFMSGHVKYK